MHLVDEARSHIAQHYRRPLAERAIRALLAAVLPYPQRFRLAMIAAKVARPLAPLFDAVKPLRPFAAMLQLAPDSLPRSAPRPVTPGTRGKVVMLRGCAEPVLNPEIQSATARLIARMDYELVDVLGERCCGALMQHIGYHDAALAAARVNIDKWSAIDGLDAILITTSG